MDLGEKTALIPGAARPIGRAIARLFAEAGAHLLLPVYDWQESISEMKEEFDRKNFSVDILQLDLRISDSAKQLAEIAAARGGLDYLINNIERGGMPVVHGSYLLAHNEGQWEREFATTLKAKWLVAPLSIFRQLPAALADAAQARPFSAMVMPRQTAGSAVLPEPGLVRRHRISGLMNWFSA